MVAETAHEAVAAGIIRYTWVIALLPFLSAALILFFGRRAPGKGSGFGIVAVGACFVMSLAVLWHFVQGGGVYASSVPWFSTAKSISAPISDRHANEKPERKLLVSAGRLAGSST